MTRTDSKKKDKKANTLPSSDRKKSKKSQKGFNDYTKSQSMDVLYEEDPSILVEALQAIADEQPIVARSIPKHAKIIEKDHNTQLKNCIFEPEVYDSMLSDSLKVCDMLQSHLDQCIISVRSKSPEAMSPVAIRRNNGSAQITSNGVSHASYSTPTVRRFPLKSCVQADV